MKFRNGWSSGLLTTMLLSFAALLLAALELKAQSGNLFRVQVMQLVAEQMSRSPVTLWRLAGFCLAVLGVYLLLGIAAWLMGLLTTYAVPAWAQRQRRLAVAWFLALWVLICTANATLFPWSHGGRGFRLLASLFPGPVPLWQAIAVLLMAAAVAVGTASIRRRGWQRPATRVLIWGGLVLIGAVVLARMPQSEEPVPVAATPPPNIVLLGIDSLRPDVVGTAGRKGYMPRLAAFTREARTFTDATTPLARTFPSWLAMLTGRSPVSTGIRENLLPRDSLQLPPTIGQRLRERGYRSIYATDEVRFANIDATYGFDQTLTPRIGASDFLLGAMNDLPLTNLLANTVVAKWLFPETYANRAAAVTYHPGAFVDRLRSDLARSDQPTLLAMHLTLPHWPYHWAADEDAVFASTADDQYAYLAAAMTVDAQFAAVLDVLRDKGLLHNSLVIVFSDHGEALNLATDNLLDSKAAKAAAGVIPVWISGHGNSVLSASQYRIFLSMKNFGVPGIAAADQSTSTEPVTIEDIAPTVLDVAGVTYAPDEFEGISLIDTLRPGSPELQLQRAARVRFTETAFSPPSLRMGQATEQDLLNEGAALFAVNPRTGWLEIKLEYWPELMATRERAAFDSTGTLAAVPAEKPGQHKYVFVPADGSLPRRLLAAPDPAADPAASRLWTALSAHYGAELGAPAADLPVRRGPSSGAAPGGSTL